MTDAELKEYAMDCRRGIVGVNGSARMCAMVCLPLQGMLAAFDGVETEIETVDFMEINHVFLRLSDGRILDPTADQFGLEPVYLGPMPRKYTRWMKEHADFVKRARRSLAGGNQGAMEPAKTPSASAAQKDSNELEKAMRLGGDLIVGGR